MPRQQKPVPTLQEVCQRADLSLLEGAHIPKDWRRVRRYLRIRQLPIRLTPEEFRIYVVEANKRNDPGFEPREEFR